MDFDVDESLETLGESTSEFDESLTLEDDSISDSELAKGRDRAESKDDAAVLEFESDDIPSEDTWADPSSDASPEDKADETSDDSSSRQWDEAANKLDLARNYLDMGDKAGARSIIDEVMREGDPSQRDQAAELASRL